MVVGWGGIELSGLKQWKFEKGMQLGCDSCFHRFLVEMRCLILKHLGVVEAEVNLKSFEGYYVVDSGVCELVNFEWLAVGFVEIVMNFVAHNFGMLDFVRYFGMELYFVVGSFVFELEFWASSPQT